MSYTGYSEVGQLKVSNNNLHSVKLMISLILTGKYSDKECSHIVKLSSEVKVMAILRRVKNMPPTNQTEGLP